MRIDTIFNCRCELSRRMALPKSEFNDMMIDSIESQIDLIRLYESVKSLNDHMKSEIAKALK